MNLTAKYSALSIPEKRELRLKYVEQQNHKCWYCGESLNEKPPIRITSKPINLVLFPKGFLKSPVHLHHDHDTDLTIGAVHAYCNAVLWQYEGK